MEKESKLIQNLNEERIEKPQKLRKIIVQLEDNIYQKAYLLITFPAE